VEYVHRPELCLERVDVCVLPLPLKAIQEAVENFMPSSSLTVVDCWRQIQPSRLQPAVKLVQMGRSRS
jgi:hypothetical protein